ncbi:MAG: DUF4345 family protein [Alcanivorax sp.]|uniref:DUF4345 family protein n=1 Tax=Alloalcanivorax marinus TaxID=1177169 RepID=UPI00195E9E03|nr:DUF4345 family protein [Alloalcanivorax marinus]MBM7332635.1 DUF4345 family protein [Alloalcanivorax marinus]
MSALMPVALAFLAMGAVAIAAPDRVLALVDVPRLPWAARSEVRAVYGGFGLAVGGLLLAAPALPAWRAGIVVTVAVALLGMAGGRLAGLLLDRRLPAWPAGFLATELLLAALLLSTL